MPAQRSDLKVEQAFFEAICDTAEITQAVGKTAVICGRTLIGTFESRSQARMAGMAKVGLAPFLMVEILPESEVARSLHAVALGVAVA